MVKFRAPILLNMKFNYDDLHSILIKTLPEEIWNPEDISNSAMAIDCITTVSEDFSQEMTGMVWHILWKADFHLHQKNL